MRIWNIALVASVLSAAVIVTLVYRGHVGGLGATPARAAGASAARPAASPEAASSAHVEIRPADETYGWGPFRTTDW